MNDPVDDPVVEPDAVVGTALQLLPIPEHDDTFWLRLEAALAAEPPHVAPAEPVRRVLVAEAGTARATDAPIGVLELDPSVAVVPAAFRRPTNALLALVAAAAVVVVVVAGNLLMDERDGTTVSGPKADEALETLVRSAQEDDGTVTTLSAKRADASSDAALAWVDDLGDGDADAAWKAMGAASQAHFSSKSEFEDKMAELVEHYRGWSGATDDAVVVTPVASADGSTIAVVTLVGPGGEVGGEALPVRIEDGDVVLEPFASAGALEVVIPEAASDDGSWETVGTDEELVFVLPSDVDAPVLQIDGGDTVVCGEADGTEFGDLDQSSGQRCAYLPQGGFEAGDHTVTIAFLGPQGDSITARSIHFHAA